MLNAPTLLNVTELLESIDTADLGHVVGIMQTMGAKEGNWTPSGRGSFGTGTFNQALNLLDTMPDNVLVYFVNMLGRLAPAGSIYREVSNVIVH